MDEGRGPRLFLVLGLAVLVLAILMVRSFLGPVVLAVATGYLMWPLMQRLAGRLPRRWMASGTLLLLAAVVLIAPLVLMTTLFIDDVQRLVQSIDSRADVEAEVERALERFGVPQDRVEAWGTRIVEESAAYLESSAIPIATFAVDFVTKTVVFAILLYYVLMDGDKMVEYLEHVAPAPRPQMQHLMEQVGDRVKAIAYGTLGVAVIQAALATLGWWLLGLPAPLFWGVVLLVLEIVPLVGSFVVLLPAAAWAFLQGDIVAGVGLLVLNFIMVGLIDDVLRPKIIGHYSGVHPALILLGLVGGLVFFGISGLILGPLLMGLLEPLFTTWAHPVEAAEERAEA